MNKEEWKDIPGYEELYQVSNMGRVKSLAREVKYKNGKVFHLKEKILKARPNNGGYLLLGLHKDGKRKTMQVHRLVAQAFVPNPDNLPEINHKDEDKENNCAENLEWCTRGYNVNFGTRNKIVGASNSKKVLCVETGVIYDSIVIAAKELHIHRSSIENCCRKYKHCHTAGGFHWRYV